MKVKILNFELTAHGQMRQWERIVDKPTLYKVLPYVKIDRTTKKVVVATPGYFQSKGFIPKKNQSLVIILKAHRIITFFWCDNPNYLFEHKEEQKYQWLYV